MEKSGKDVPVETVVISTDGTVLRRSIAGCA